MDSLLSFPVGLFHPLQHAGLSRRSTGNARSAVLEHHCAAWANPRSRPKLRGVIGRPVAERSRRRSGDLCDCGCHERRLTGCRSPGVEQHIHDKSRHENEQFAPRLIWRDLFHAQRAADHMTDCRYLLELAQGLRPGQNIFGSGVSVLTQGADRDRGDVPLVDRRCRSGKIGPADDIAGADTRSAAAKRPFRTVVVFDPEQGNAPVRECRTLKMPVKRQGS
jgi:hypothetical protein